MLGASLTVVTAMVKVFVALSTPPLAVPPLSSTTTVTVAWPLALRAEVKVSTPALLIAGATLKRPVLSTVTV